MRDRKALQPSESFRPALRHSAGLALLSLETPQTPPTAIRARLSSSSPLPLILMISRVSRFFPLSCRPSVFPCFSPLRSFSYHKRARVLAVPGTPSQDPGSDSTLLDSPLFRKFVNSFMRDGVRGPVEKAAISAFTDLKIHSNRNPHTIFLEFIECLRPLIGMMKRNAPNNDKLGQNAFVLVPVPLKERRQVILALKWLRQVILQSKIKNTRRQGVKRAVSRVKGDWDIFHAAHANQQLRLLLRQETMKNSPAMADLMRKKSEWYSKVAENRTFINYRWV